MGSRQDKQPASLPQLLKEQDEIMLLWNVFWRGFEIQPISFYLKQCALTVETFQLAIDPVTDRSRDRAAREHLPIPTADQAEAIVASPASTIVAPPL
ncbi:hypothetical protein L1987_88433 [Smallanthus sonchifolius]|nr:hypothetical protein L1987_89903 [Smallanthus sonchifolius]KAI3664590.1 hypothetical protein L1987_89636 [Smallanthus sonchifolius]KAI3664684.1 hypothetical protein L1987_89549 [Smallanthus sonchifolius]KAI3664718.1 hypothetical protein L1987_89507 [Smallanthus sonchifolius]KAI3664748.1 hypothetical protein L1987_89485 [Smallanthus sonchifolius]